jgi:hypothetical protein
MADGASPTIPPRDAISLGMRYFNELMEGQAMARILLEGLGFDETSGNWVVTVGFDSQRVKPQQYSPAIRAIANALAKLPPPETLPPEFEIVREFRAVHISSVDGAFVKMEHA